MNITVVHWYLLDAIIIVVIREASRRHAGRDLVLDLDLVLPEDVVGDVEADLPHHDVVMDEVVGEDGGGTGRVVLGIFEIAKCIRDGNCYWRT